MPASGGAAGAWRTCPALAAASRQRPAQPERLVRVAKAAAEQTGQTTPPAPLSTRSLNLRGYARVVTPTCW
jgi:16S rRNA U1498 N3-methylase RsmE